MPQTERNKNYWERVTERWVRFRPDTLWRAHSDAVNCALVSSWLPDQQVPRLLKTDLFDEAVSGGLYPLILSRARTVVGVDLSISTVRAARDRLGGKPIACADVRCLPFADAAFDVVVSNSTLDHFQSQAELVAGLRELYRVLQPGGRLLLTLDNLSNPVVAIRNMVPFRVLYRLGVVPYYIGATCGPLRLRRLLQELPMTILEMKTILHCLRAPAVLLARWLAKHSAPTTQHDYLKWLMRFERLSHWPTRFLTGYYVAVLARRNDESHTSEPSRRRM